MVFQQPCPVVQTSLTVRVLSTKESVAGCSHTRITGSKILAAHGLCGQSIGAIRDHCLGCCVPAIALPPVVAQLLPPPSYIGKQPKSGVKGGDIMPELSEKQQDKLESSEFAFPKQRKEPINDVEQIRNAIARFDQVEGVTNKERDEAWERITRAARKHGIELNQKDWRDLFRRNDQQIPKD